MLNSFGKIFKFHKFRIKLRLCVHRGFLKSFKSHEVLEMNARLEECLVQLTFLLETSYGSTIKSILNRHESYTDQLLHNYQSLALLGSSHRKLEKIYENPIKSRKNQ